VVSVLGKTSIDLIDISGGTYFPGAKSASDSSGKGPYFLNFAEQARKRTTKPLMATGGFKTLAQATDALSSGAVDMVGLARTLVIEPSLPNLWLTGECPKPEFPRFANPPEGGVTACYTMRLTEIGEDHENTFETDLDKIIHAYETRDQERAKIWLQHFGRPATT
jgi:tRNA-dihydrouridine synthase